LLGFAALCPDAPRAASPFYGEDGSWSACGESPRELRGIATCGQKKKKPTSTLLSKRAFSGSCAGAQLHVDNWVYGAD
jgi:hypothetical protein